VILRAMGPLGDRLGPRFAVSVELPATVGDVLRGAARERPSAGGLLLTEDGRPVPAVYRGGRRVAASDAVADGEVLDLVLSLAGG
jgi:hypothetical protein